MATLEFIARSGASVTAYGSMEEMWAASPDLTGFGFSLNDDWYTISDSKSNLDERIVADGAYEVVRDWRSQLPLSFSCWYRGKTRAAVRAARNQVNAILGGGGMVTVRFTDQDEVTERDVSIRSAKPDDDRGQLAFRFNVISAAPDPHRYGAEQVFSGIGVPSSGGGLLFPLGTNRTTGLVDASAPYWDFGADGTSGRVALTNDGTTDAFPSIEVYGGLSAGFVIRDQTSGKEVRFERAIPVGSVVTIDQRTGVAIIDGQCDVSGYITSWDFFSIGPGETHIIQFSPLGTVSGTPTATLRFQSAYVG